MKSLGWFSAIIISLIAAWGISRFFKSYKASQIATLSVGVGWLLWTGGLSSFIVGYALSGPLLGAQVGLIVAACFVIVFLGWLYNHQKKKQEILKQENVNLNQRLAELAKEFHASITEDVTSNRVIKGARNHRSELFNQISKTKNNLIILSGWANDFGIDRQIKKKLNQLVKNNINLTLGWGYKRSNNETLPFTKAEKWLKELQKKYPSNIRLLYYQNHSKAVIRDNEEAIIGSFNWLSNSGHSKNDELSLVITDRDIITKLKDSICAYNKSGENRGQTTVSGP